MRYSQLFLPTLKESPAEAEVVSHQLMIRAGMIRKVASGLYTYLPLGLRAIRRVERIIREEMDRAGAQELLMPMVQPAELWQESGRWELYGPELLRLKDRHQRDFCLGPTHEEVICSVVRREVRSYRDLPLNLYQIHTKFRDEIRPRFGLMRGREFIMKDAYSFDVDEEGLERTYQAMYEAYSRIFQRCGLEFRAVEADTGSIGGHASHEFMVMADTGEDSIACCRSCSYAANVELAPVTTEYPPDQEAEESLREVATPGKRSVEEVTGFLGIGPERLVKTLILEADGRPVAALVRGDHELNQVKLKNLLGAQELSMADEEVVRRLTGAPVGFAGPVGLSGEVTVVADRALQGRRNLVCGANRADTHLTGLNLGRDCPLPRFADIRIITEQDPCPRCSGPIEIRRGIEVGHIFKLGTKYSEPLRVTFLDEKGRERPAVMGCYGIGVGRTVAAAIEQNHDERGISFPPPIAPFDCIITVVNAKDRELMEAAEALEERLSQAGLEVLLDDRDERAGVKFKDAELIGIPVRVTVGRKLKEVGKVEVVRRRDGRVAEVPPEEVVEAVR